MNLRLHQLLLAFVLSFVSSAVTGQIRPAYPHDWYSGVRNPVTRVGCCGGRDCAPIDISRVVETHDEFIIDGKWHFNKDEAMPSQDGGYHACIWGGKPRCFFVPQNV
jgi:hypothetical protein